MINILKFKTESIFTELEVQVAHLTAQRWTKSNGLVIPLNCLNFTYLNTNKNDIFDILQSNKNIADEILRAKKTYWHMEFLDDLQNIKQLFPDQYKSIYYIWAANSPNLWKDIEWSSIISDPNTIEAKSFSLSIHSYEILWFEELNQMKKFLSSSIAKLYLSWWSINFEYLSDCLSVLSLCIDWKELNHIHFEYSESDIENEQEAIYNAFEEFIKKFGIISGLKIKKSKDKYSSMNEIY